MSSRIVAAVVIAFLAFALYSWFTTQPQEGFMNINSQQYENRPISLPSLEVPLGGETSPGGPSAPSQRPPKDSEATIAMDEVPFDPQGQSYESAEIPERLRHPERSYGPGLMNTDTDTAVAAGTASYAQQAATQAYQVFGPEFAQNGGIFMDSVMANDTSLNQDYSSV